MTFSFIVATEGKRHSLWKTLGSIKTLPGDEILVAGELSPEDRVKLETTGAKWVPSIRGQDWGATERNRAINVATCDFVSFMDDDDVYAPSAREVLATITEKKPHVFRMQYPDGRVLWADPIIAQGNVGTPMMVMPRDEKLGRFGSRYEGDFDFIIYSKWNAADFIFRKEIIALVRPV